MSLGVSLRKEVFSANITHNLTAMADAAGIYQACWHPDDLGITYAHQLLPYLRDGLALLESDPDRFRQLNPENGWGDYEGFVQWVRDYLEACATFPNSTIEVSR